MSDDVISPGHVVPVAPLRIIIFGSVSHVWPLIEALGMATYTIWIVWPKIGRRFHLRFGVKVPAGGFCFFLDRSILSLLLMVIRRINFRAFYAFPRISVDTNCWTTKNQIVTAVFTIQCFIHVLIGRSNGHIWAWASACSFVWIFGSLFYISPFEKILASERDRSLEKFTDR